MLECRALVTGYPGHTVSDGISLCVGSGEIVCLIGPNGCGKTTLLKTAAGLLPPRNGAVLLDGEDIFQLDSRHLARKRAYLPQMQSIPDLTVEMLISHGRFPYLGFSRRLSARDRAAVENAMSLTGTAEWRGQKLSQLSGGQRQRVYLAMTAAQDTPLLLWDEPTTYLDAASRLMVMQVARQLRDSGKTILMTLQDIPEALTVSDRICLMDDSGSLRLMGRPDEVSRSDAIRQIFGFVPEQVTLQSGRTAYVLDMADDR